jgi:hypothetical protein
MPTHLSVFPGDRIKPMGYSPNISKQKHWLEYDYNSDTNNSKEAGSNQRKEEDDAMRSLRRIQETSLGLNKTGLSYSEASRDRKLALIQTLSPAPVRQPTTYRELSTERYTTTNANTQSDESLRMTSAPTPTWARKTRRVVSGSYEAGKEEFRKEDRSTFQEALKERYAQRQRLQGESSVLPFEMGNAHASSSSDSRSAYFDATPQFDWAAKAHYGHGHGQHSNRKYSLSPAEVIFDRYCGLET